MIDFDTDVFFDEFAVDAIFSGSSETISVLIDKDQDPETGRYINLITAKKSDVDGIAINDTFTIDSIVYYVTSIEPILSDELILTIRVSI